MTPEEELCELSEVLTALYGEDIAHDAVLRVLQKGYQENWVQKEMLISRRKHHQAEKRESLSGEFLEELHPTEDDTNRIIAYIELQERAQTNLAFRQLLLIELGFVEPIDQTTSAGKVTLHRLRKESQHVPHPRRLLSIVWNTNGTRKGRN